MKNEDALNRYIEQTNRCYGVLEGQLKKTGGESVLPGGITAVDLHFLPWIVQHEHAQLTLDPYPMVKKWLDMMQGLKEVKQAYQRVKEGTKA